MLRRSLSGLTLVLCGLTAVGCSGSGRDASRSTTTVTVADPTTSTTADPAAPTADPSDQAVLDAYRAFWSMYVDLSASPPPFDAVAVTSRLDALTVGAEQKQLFAFLQSNAANGVVLRGDLDNSPTVESNDGTTAVIRDCMDDRLGVFRADGSRVDQDVPGRTVYLTQLRLVGGAWRVEQLSTKGESCAV